MDQIYVFRDVQKQKLYGGPHVLGRCSRVLYCKGYGFWHLKTGGCRASEHRKIKTNRMKFSGKIHFFGELAENGFGII